MLTRAGVLVPGDPARYSEQLEEETVREIDALFEDVRPVLPRLKADGHRLFLSTNATRSNGESALIGGGVRDRRRPTVAGRVRRRRLEIPGARVGPRGPLRPARARRPPATAGTVS